MSRVADDSTDDEFAASEPGDSSAVGARLGSLFHGATNVNGNTSLTYKPPRQPPSKESSPNEVGRMQKPSTGTDEEGTPVRVLFATTAHTFLLTNGEYASKGKLGVALLGNRPKKEYRLLLYLGNKQPVAQATVSADFQLTISGGYAQFSDDRAALWALTFDSERHLLDLLKWIFAVRAVGFGEHRKEIIMMDLQEGEGVAVGIGDSLEIQYNEFLIEDGPTITEFNGNMNANQPALRIKLGKGKVPKGWEDGLIGMKKFGKRLFVIPPEMGFFGHDTSPSFPTNTPLMLYAIVNRVKVSKKKILSHLNGSEGGSSLDNPSSNKLPESVEPDSIETTPPDTQRSASETDIHKKTNLINRMAKIGHAVIVPQSATPENATDPNVVSTGATSEALRALEQQRSHELAVVCADMSLARPVVTQTTANTTKTSASAVTRSEPSGVPANFGASHEHVNLNHTPQMPMNNYSSSSTMPYMFPFPYFFHQPPHSAGSVATSMPTIGYPVDNGERQAILEEIRKRHAHLLEELTKVYTDGFNEVTTKISTVNEGVEAKLMELKSHWNEPQHLPESSVPYEPAGSNSMQEQLLSKLESIEAKLLEQSYMGEAINSIEKKLATFDGNLSHLTSVVNDLRNSQTLDSGSSSGRQSSEIVNDLSASLTENLAHLQTMTKNFQEAQLKSNDAQEEIKGLRGEIERLRRASSEKSDISVNEKQNVKKIMNGFYKLASQEFDDDSTLNGADVRRIILNAVKTVTLRVLNEENMAGNEATGNTSNVTDVQLSSQDTDCDDACSNEIAIPDVKVG